MTGRGGSDVASHAGQVVSGMAAEYAQEGRPRLLRCPRSTTAPAIRRLRRDGRLGRAQDGGSYLVRLAGADRALLGRGGSRPARRRGSPDLPRSASPRSASGPRRPRRCALPRAGRATGDSGPLSGPPSRSIMTRHLALTPPLPDGRKPDTPQRLHPSTHGVRSAASSSASGTGPRSTSSVCCPRSAAARHIRAGHPHRLAHQPPARRRVLHRLDQSPPRGGGR
jgi:hypothetical protein